jgi:hypothetical protein
MAAHFATSNLSTHPLNRKFMKKLLAVSLLGLASVCHAQSPGSTNVLIGIDAGFGGDTLATARYTNGKTQDIKAGNGVQVKGGLQYHLNSSTAFQASIGYQFNSTNATDGSISFTRWPIEVLGMWKLSEQFRLGGGVRYVTGAKLSSDGLASSIGNHSFESTPGFLVMGEYLISESTSITARYVDDKYTINGGTINGGHGSVGLNFYF